jgi:prepilin-type N-terminal cleavage/methylation domain-containing protein
MEIKSNRAAAGNRAFTLMEVMLAVVIVGVEFVSLYVAISQGFAVVQSARENLRATQIMQEQVEVIRVLDWDKITSTPSPWSFNASFYPSNGINPGITYLGSIAVSDAPAPSAYAADMRLVVVSLSWTNGANARLMRNRELRTLVSRYGMHNYFLQP